MNVIDKIQKLSLTDLALVSGSMALLPLVAVLIRLAGVRRTRRIVGKAGIPGLMKQSKALNSVETAQRIARLVNIASNRGLYRADCLKKCIVLEFWLSRFGIDSFLNIGIKTNSETFHAHAWIESDGKVIGESSAVQDAFQVLS